MSPNLWHTLACVNNLVVNLLVHYVIRLLIYDRVVDDRAATAAQVPQLSTVSHYCERWQQTRLSSQLSVDRSVFFAS